MSYCTAGGAPAASPALNIAAYRFVDLDDAPALVDSIREKCEARRLKGTVLVAPEGINLFLAGSGDDVRAFLDQLQQDPRFAGLEVKSSESAVVPFRRLRVRLKKEVITFRKHGLSPGSQRAASVAPTTLRDWLRAGKDDQGRDLVLLDTRNRQEVAFGSFQQALTLPIDRFTALPDALEAHAGRLRGKTIVSFCTGGIRCEKAAIWMQQAGYENVFQLDGGILNYFEQAGGEGYSGHCFVFDERVALDPQLKPMETPDVS